MQKNKLNNRLYYILSLISLFIFLIIYFSSDKEKKVVSIDNFNGEVNVPDCILMYDYIEKYSEIYDIPRYIAYNVAWRETRYGGPFDMDYDPRQGSSAGALGPMQIMTSTANSKVYTDSLITNSELRDNIELNIIISMKILKRSYDRYGNWKIVCGKYNTGKEIINEYAIYCATNKNYTKNWQKPIKYK
jgi:soluble lytic murein transglycosylase-like protein